MKHRIVVLGAGYAGLPAAKRLARLLRADEVEVTLVSGCPEFIERPRLHQLAMGESVEVVPLARYLSKTPVRYLPAWVRAIDLEERVVTLGSELAQRQVHYDTLVYALGSNIDLESVPGSAAHTHALTDLPAAHRLRRALPDVADAHGRLLVCGGGLTGIETAAEAAEAHPGLQVQLLSAGAPGDRLSAKGRAYLDSTLARLGVEVLAGARIREVLPDAVVLVDGRRVAFDVAAWAAGFRVPELARQAGLGVTAHGRVRVGNDLRSLSHPDVYVIGDAAAVGGPWGEDLAMGCRTGGFTGPKVADVIAARLTGRTVKPFRFRYFHECISLGRKQGLIQFLEADQTPKERILTGRKAITYKNLTLNGARMIFRHPGPALARRRRLTVTQPTRQPGLRAAS